MIDIVQHDNGQWFIALNPLRKGGQLNFEYAWSGEMWTKNISRILFFASAAKARQFLKVHRQQIDAAFIEAPGQAP